MLQVKAKVEPRTTQGRPLQSKNSLKGKNINPDNFLSAKFGFEEMKLTQSHEIGDSKPTQFRLNIISPNQTPGSPEIVAKKFTSPEWLAVSHMTASFQTHLSGTISENPENSKEDKQSSCNDYENSSEDGQKTESQKGDQLKLDPSQVQKILEMTVSDDKERSINEVQIKSQKTNEDLESKSAFVRENHSPSSDHDKTNFTNYQFDHSKVASYVVCKPKSAIVRHIRSQEELDQYYKKELQMLSEYGLKPCEQNRLRKIQQIQKFELLAEKADAFPEEGFNQHQQYFNLSKNKKTGKIMGKFRKCSAAVQSNTYEKHAKQHSKKSVSKQKHSLSKDKKTTIQSNGKLSMANVKIVKKQSGGK